MEERIIDQDELRKVRVTRTDGGLDVVDDTLPEDAVPPAEQDEEGIAELKEEYAVEFEGEEYDEDLVGLTPTQFKEEMERRERLAREAHEASEKLCAEGDVLAAAEDFAAAEEKYESALLQEPSSERAEHSLWAARTKNYTSDEALYTRRVAEEFPDASEEVRARVFEVFGDGLRADRAETQAEAEPLRAAVEEGQRTRRGPFRANRNYYMVRLGIALGVLALFLVGICVSASFILRTQSPAPVALTGAFGVLAFAALVMLVYFSRKTFVAVRLCRENERLTSTEEGTRLAELEEKLACLALVLGAAPSAEEAGETDGSDKA